MVSKIWISSLWWYLAVAQDQQARIGPHWCRWKVRNKPLIPDTDAAAGLQSVFLWAVSHNGAPRLRLPPVTMASCRHSVSAPRRAAAAPRPFQQETSPSQGIMGKQEPPTSRRERPRPRYDLTGLISILESLHRMIQGFSRMVKISDRARTSKFLPKLISV